MVIPTVSNPKSIKVAKTNQLLGRYCLLLIGSTRLDWIAGGGLFVFTDSIESVFGTNDQVVFMDSIRSKYAAWQ